jgi:hypothetical protein
MNKDLLGVPLFSAVSERKAAGKRNETIRFPSSDKAFHQIDM